MQVSNTIPTMICCLHISFFTEIIRMNNSNSSDNSITAKPTAVNDTTANSPDTAGMEDVLFMVFF